MHRKKLLADLEEYRSSTIITTQEKPMLVAMMNFIMSNEQCFERSNPGHITSGAWIMNAQKTEVLLTHHKKFDMWCQLGGHNDGNPSCKETALKEAEEESGITGFTFLHQGIFDIDIHPIPGSCEYHYDVRYLLQAPTDAHYTVSEESHDLAWVPLAKLKEYTQEASVLRMAQKAI
jgi:8-oxo-dGTP pyrophosphatase MutT (NUDIX family)